MSRRTKILLGVVVAGVLAMGAVAGGALAQVGPDDEQAQPLREEFLSRAAEKLGVTGEELRGALRSTGLEMLDEAVEEGKISERVAERVRQRVEEGRLLPRPPRERLAQQRLKLSKLLVVHAAAETLDMGTRELVGELRATGQSLAEVAEAKGVSREELKDGILGDIQKHADERLERLRENIDSIIDRTPEPPPAPPSE